MLNDYVLSSKMVGYPLFGITSFSILNHNDDDWNGFPKSYYQRCEKMYVTLINQKLLKERVYLLCSFIHENCDNPLPDAVCLHDC